MKNLTIIMACLVLMACDKNNNTSPPETSNVPTCETLEFVGSWDNQAMEDTLTINSDCTAQSLYCGHEYSFTIPNAEGLSFLTVNTVNLNEGCMPMGTYVCALAMDQDDLYIDCGAPSQFLFTRILL